MEEATIACNARLEEQEEMSNDVENDEDGFVMLESGGELLEEMAADAGAEHDEDDKHEENNKETNDGGQSNVKSAWEAHGEAVQAIGERIYESPRSLREAPKPSAELLMSLEEAAIACDPPLKKQKEIRNAVENDERGVITLESAGELLEEMTADADSEHNEDDTHKKNNKEKVQAIGERIYEFPRSLREAPKPTAELFMSLEEAAIACDPPLKKQKEIRNAVENDERGVIALESAGELLQEMAADADSEHNEDDKHKENNKEKVQAIGERIYESPISLREAPKPTAELFMSLEEATIACNVPLKKQKEIHDVVENDEPGVIALESAGELLQEMAADADSEHNEDDKHKENNKEKVQAIGERIYESPRSLREAPKPTAELFMSLEEATIACNARLKEQKEIRDAVENDERGVITLESAGKLFDEMAADANTENNKEKKDKGQSYTKSACDVVEKICKLIYESSKSLREAPNTPLIRELITEKTRDYKDYLMSTKEGLQEQRLRFTRLGNTTSNLIFFVLADFDGMEEALDKLPYDAAKQRQIGAFARDNEDDFVKELEIFSKALKDGSGKESIRELQEKLQTMQNDMEKLMAKNKKRSEQEKMRTFSSLACGAPVALDAVYTRTSKTLFSNHYSTTMPDKLQGIETSMKETIDEINKGLEKIMTSFSQVENSLNQIFLDWADINGAVTPSGTLFHYETNVKNLVRDLSATKESIDVLCGNFQKTEKDVSSALDSYNEDIYKHVLGLYK